MLRLPSGLHVRVVEAGPRSGRPVVLLPGWAASAFTYRYQLPALAAAGYRAVAVDLKGLGFSDKPTGAGEYSFDAMLRHVAEVVAAVAQEPAVVAQSMAGRLAIELGVSERPVVAGLVLVSPVGIGRVPFIGLARLLTPRAADVVAPLLIGRRTVRMALRMAYGGRSPVSEDAVEEYLAPRQFPGFARALRALVHDFDWAPVPASRLEALSVPTLVIRGTLDRLVIGPPRRHVDGLQRAELLVLDDAGHALNEQCPEPTNAALLAFLARWYPPAG